MSGEASEHNDSSSFRDFAAEYEQISSLSKEQSGKIEELTQEVYSLRSRLVVSERIQADYQTEIDSQQQQLHDLNASHALSILKLKEEHAERVEDLESKILSLENDLSELRQKQVLEKDELVKTRKELREFQDTSPVASLKAELQELVEEHAAGRLACEQHQELNQILLKDKTALFEELNNTREHLEMMEEKLKICKSDMTDQSETIEELRESLAVAQSELAGLKAGPSDSASRGNSLFAEVEDKRQDMLKKCSSLSKKYNEMKKDYGAKCAEIKRLNMENLKLRRKWQEEAEERDNRDVWLKDNYEIRIQELLKLVNDLKRDEKPVFVNGDSKILTFAEDLVERSRKEMAQLRNEMEQRSSERLNEAKALYMARGEILTLRSQVLSANAENLVLRDKLGEANITDLPSPKQSLERLKKTLFSSDGLMTASTQTDPVEENNHILEYPKEDVKYEIPACTSTLPVSSSLLPSLPKPKRLIKAEMMERLQLSNDDSSGVSEDDNSLLKHTESLTFNAESGPDELAKLGMEECSSVKEEASEEPFEFVLPSPTKPIGLFKAEIKEQNIQFESLSESNSAEILREDIFTRGSSKLEPEPKLEDCSQTVSVKREELHHGNQSTSIDNSDAENSCESESCFQKPTHDDVENILPIPKFPAPRQSILAKVSRPSLIPIDQNLTRRVRFADPQPASETETFKSEVSVKQSPPKKLVRTAKPKMTRRIIVSKETEYQ